ncbi:hypothetical protein G7046_g8026 [Stylonectria norvegica]|nr:hypothetical protein G7046_g8026 [Stylonectria norvegica]
MRPKMSSGERKAPPTLPTTTEMMAAASSPPDDRVMTTLDAMVVGRQAVARSPMSICGLGVWEVRAPAAMEMWTMAGEGLLCPSCSANNRSARQRTKNNRRYNCKANPLHNHMQPPISQVGLELRRRELQPANEEDEGHGAVQDAILGPDRPAMLSDGSQHTRHAEPDEEVLVQHELGRHESARRELMPQGWLRLCVQLGRRRHCAWRWRWSSRSGERGEGDEALILEQVASHCVLGEESERAWVVTWSKVGELSDVGVPTDRGPLAVLLPDRRMLRAGVASEVEEASRGAGDWDAEVYTATV